MPFRIWNAAGILQQTLNGTLSLVRWNFLRVFGWHRHVFTNYGRTDKYDLHGILMCTALSDETLQKVVLVTLGARFHTSVTTAHQQDIIERATCITWCDMYNMIRQDLNWTHMESTVYEVLHQRRSSAQNGSQMTNKREIHISSAVILLESVVNDILEPSSRTTTWNQHVVMKTGGCSKLTEAILTAKISSTQKGTIFISHWSIFHGIASYVLNDNDTQFMSKCFLQPSPFLSG